jgi:4,5-dihydroxyphthalate decarboxylase
VPEYQLTANVWARARLSDDYGIHPENIHWVRGGIENPTRPEKIAVDLPRGVRLDDAPEGMTISALLECGEIDAFIAPRPPSLIRRGHPHVGWLFPDPVAVAKDYFQRTGLFPIMHVVGGRHTLAVQYPWLPGAILKALEQAKAVGLRELSDTSAPKVTSPFIEERLEEVRASMGKDFGRTAWKATAKCSTTSSTSITRRAFPNAAFRSMSSSMRRLTKASNFKSVQLRAHACVLSRKFECGR